MPDQNATKEKNTGLTIGLWASKLVLIGIFTVVGWLPKIAMPTNSEPLVEKLTDYGGRTAVTAIGIMELVVILLLLIPKTALVGSVLAAGVMLGAIASHLGPVGMEGDFLGVFIMAIVALLAAIAHGVLMVKR